MQLFSADATIFKNKIAPENMKKTPSKIAHYKPKSHFLFHKNVSLCNSYIKTLPLTEMYKSFAQFI